MTLVPLLGAGRTVTRLFPLGLGRALGPGFPDGPLSGSLGGGQRPSQSPGRLQGVWGAVTRDASACALVLTAEVYIGIGKPAEATACTQEAANLFPMSHNVLYMRGQVAELRGNVDEARRWYEEALSISPTHVKSMQRLVSAGVPLRGSGCAVPVVVCAGGAPGGGQHTACLGAWAD